MADLGGGEPKAAAGPKEETRVLHRARKRVVVAGDARTAVMTKSNSQKFAVEDDAMVLNTMQLLLAEKRTALSSLRTGIAIFAFPLSVLSVLIATSRSYEATHVLHWLIPLLAINLGLCVLAVYLVVRSIRKIRHYDQVIRDFQSKHRVLATLLD